MPKIIEGLREKILAEAKRQALENGYSAMTVRSVVKSCGISTGTLYNYFESKESLTAFFLLEDWLAALEKMKVGCEQAKAGSEACRGIYSAIIEFYDRYRAIFSDSSAAKSSAQVFSLRHTMLRGQISQLLTPFADGFLPQFIAEALIAWSVEGREYSELEPTIKRLFEK